MIFWFSAHLINLGEEIIYKFQFKNYDENVFLCQQSTFGFGINKTSFCIRSHILECTDKLFTLCLINELFNEGYLIIEYKMKNSNSIFDYVLIILGVAYSPIEEIDIGRIKMNEIMSLMICQLPWKSKNKIKIKKIDSVIIPKNNGLFMKAGELINIEDLKNSIICTLISSYIYV
ncbi:hypothetical protein HZS_4315 [Henneguya salminicola]|nr:hypothetical protein HZS_4315 [Henneguya salminicola]